MECWKGSRRSWHHGATVTKPKIGFAAEDHVMWRRAAWLAEGKPISEDADTWEGANICLHQHLRMDDSKETLIARFGYRHWLDAERADQALARRTVANREKRLVDAESAELRNGLQEQQVAQNVQIADRQNANRAIVPLRTARVALREALAHLLAAKTSERRPPAAFEKPVPQEEELDARIANALTNVETVLDAVTDRRGGGWLGLSASEREAELTAELLSLRDAGYTVEQLAFLAGSPVEDCAWQESAWKRMQRRLSTALKKQL